MYSEVCKNKDLDFLTGISDHQYNGETPIASEIANTPYAVPLRSQPTITNARSIFASGFSSTLTTYCSQPFLISFTSISPLWTKPSIVAFLPKVPIIITFLPLTDLEVLTFPFLPVTR